MRTTIFFFGLLVLSGMAGSGCKTARAQKLTASYDNPQAVFHATSLGLHTNKAEISYTGCGGFFIEYEGETVALDPFFTYRSMWSASVHAYKTDSALVRDFYVNAFGSPYDESGKITSVLMSHSHYDHLGDLPYQLRNHLNTKQIKVYGSGTTCNILRSFPALVRDTAKQYINLEHYLDKASRVQRKATDSDMSPFFYTPKRKMRFAAIPSDHAGHFCIGVPLKIPFIGGDVMKPNKKPPSMALDYKEGQNYNFVIDLLNDDGKPIFRIFSQAGAACNAGVGYPPVRLREEKNFDLLLLCGASYGLAKHYPSGILAQTRPDAVFLAHWENFFKSQRKLRQKAEVVPNTNIPKLMNILEQYRHDHGFPKEILLEQPCARKMVFKF